MKPRTTLLMQTSSRNMQLPKKTIVIIGGAGLLGSAFSRACRAEGADVVIVDTNEKTSSKLASEVGASFIETNIADEKALINLKKALEKKYGTIDGLVHAAYPKSKNYGATIEKADAKELLENIDLQLGGPLLTTRTLMPILKKGASVVFFSSIYGIAAPRFEIYKGTTMMGVPGEYAAVKAGVLGVTRFFAGLLGKREIRVNAISPGGIFDNQPKPFVRAYSKKALIPPGLLSPQDIAGSVVFLLSDASKKMTGQNLVVDGGWTL